MKRYILMVAVFLAASVSLRAQNDVIAPGENLVADGVPPILASLAETAGQYTENREAFQTDWHPTRREMIIGTRFGNTYQAHVVAMPQGARRQLTFFQNRSMAGLFIRREGIMCCTSKTLVEANGTSSFATTWR
jgi:hypothetical protein